MRKLTVLAAILLLSPLASQAASLEDLLIEKGVITKNEARASHHSGAAKVYWNKGTRLDFDDTGFTSKINTDVISRYTYTDFEDGAGADTSSFSVERARLTVSGTALHGEFSYKVEAELTDGSNQLRDAYLEWHACDQTSVRMGQFKPLISRQYQTSATKLLLPNRSVVSDFYTIDRNQGVQGSVDLAKGVVLVGQFLNGQSTGEGINSRGVDTNHTGVVGIRADIMGSMDAASESDVDNTEEAALNVGAAVAISEVTNALVDSDITTVSADLNFKSNGFSLNGEFFYQENDPDGGSKVESTGFYVQGGYFITPKTFEIAARYSNLDCDNGAAVGNGFATDIANVPSCAGNDAIDAVDVGLNYYWWKHSLKAQVAWMFVSEDALSGSNNETNRWVFQLSSWF